MATTKKTTTTTKKVDAKSEIKAANATARAASATKKDLKQDPYAAAKKAESARVRKSAEAAIDTNLFSEDVKQQYKDLVEDIANKKAELNELYGIETEAAQIADMISAHNLIQADLDEQALLAESERAAKKAADEKAYTESIQALKDEFARVEKELTDKENIFRADLKTAREREAAEFKYNQDRTRSLENDAWNDVKAAREKELASKEAEAAERLSKIEAREAKMDELEAKVCDIPSIKEAAFKEGKELGKAEADKSHAFEKRALEKQSEYNQGILQNEVNTQNKIIESLEAKVKSLEEKLDAAYQRNQELATTVAKNSGTTVIQQSEGSGVAKK